MGIYSNNWAPPDAWQPVASIPSQIGQWQTVHYPLGGRSQTTLNYIGALVFENLGGTTGTIYLDNIRLRRPSGPQTLAGVQAIGLADHNQLFWRAVNVQGLSGYHVYRSTTAGGPFSRITTTPVVGETYFDDVGVGAPRYFYQVTAVVSGQESPASDITTALYNGLTDDQLLDAVQQAAFRYFWDGGHPNCGMAREGIGLGHPLDTVTIGGTGFGIMSIIVGAERGWITRAQAADRIRRIVRFLDGVRPDNPSLPSGVQRYHGAWAHHYNGVTGATIPFAGAADNGADLVETSFLVVGLLTARQYFDNAADPVESEVVARSTSMWRTVEFSWFRRFSGGQVLYWHWSPNFAWQMNLPIRGFNETQIIYLLAIASPTFPMPPTSYVQGYASLSDYVNGNTYYGHKQWVGEPLGGPLFFTHYSNLGFDPRFKHDQFCNYYDNARNISLINRAHCIDNPGAFEGYGPLNWGLTASNNPTGYSAQSPTNDNGTISPTAALSAMPYAPAESIATLRYWYDNFGADVFGTYGPFDAFNLQSDWFAPGWLAIDQGPIVVMIENYRSRLCWDLFMSNPEIEPMMRSIGFRYDVDFDGDGYVTSNDLAVFANCMAGPQIAAPPVGVTQQQFDLADLERDAGVDMHDLAIMQRLSSGS